MDPPQQPHQMSHHIVNVDAGEEKLIKDSCAEVLSLKLIFHGDETSHKTMEEGVLTMN